MKHEHHYITYQLFSKYSHSRERFIILMGINTRKCLFTFCRESAAAFHSVFRLNCRKLPSRSLLSYGPLETLRFVLSYFSNGRETTLFITFLFCSTKKACFWIKKTY